jgi:hypothetical protein
MEIHTLPPVCLEPSPHGDLTALEMLRADLDRLLRSPSV